LVRNQIAAVVGSLAWIFVVEQLLVALLPAVGRWTPGGASSAVLQLGDLASTRGDLLPVWGGALLLVAYAVVLSVLAAQFTLRRDLT
ncbi:MAG: ABC transporter permease, partial [Frankiales bacterium]|nr:ABC transporter permease [Frankiales bacterium]